ncbi:MAG: TraB family protein [Deltaproteobacteria bacterium]|nr:MAG: TraB family protein [Deltaproteobacteria bacterium]
MTDSPDPVAPLELTANVTHLEYEGKDIYVVGTAHISQKSVEEVLEVIAQVKPDTVCVELDAMRLAALSDNSRWEKLDIFQVIKEKKVLFLMTSLVLSAYQRRMGEALGVQPGAEMVAAVKAARESGAELVLVDRNIQATLKRTWRNLSFINKSKVTASLIASFFAAGEISEEQIEELKDRDNISDMMKEFAEQLPQVQVPLIDERDRFLISATREAPGKKIVCVVGAGHVEGMVKYLHEEVDREALSKIPPVAGIAQLLKWVIPAVVLGAFYWGYHKHQGQGLAEMLYAWILPNSIAAGLFAILALAKPLTVVTSILASPITSLNPTIGAGMVSGLVEAYLRKPTVADCESIPEDSKTWRGIYRNQFTRVLLVAVATTMGSALGGWIGATWVVSLL